MYVCLPRKATGAFHFFNDDTYLVRNLFLFKIYCTLCVHCICTLTGHIPSTWCTHDVPAHFSSYCVKWPCNNKAAMQFALTTFHLCGCRTLSVCHVSKHVRTHIVCSDSCGHAWCAIWILRRLCSCADMSMEYCWQATWANCAYQLVHT